MKNFLDQDFLLQTDTARELYHEHAAKMPIIDYHCHLDPRQIAENHQFEDLTEIWLGGDHYKWRAMRANGIPEEYITGDKPSYEKFLKWAETMPYTMRNPLYHWTHLELSRIFGIHKVLNPASAEEIYATCTDKLRTPEYRAQAIMKRMNVEIVCTTDDPIDSLEFHQKIRSSGCHTRVYPAWRPDKVLAIDNFKALNDYLSKLEAAADKTILTYKHLLEALQKRHDFFAAQGCRLSDHGLDTFYAEPYTEQEIEVIFLKARMGKSLTEQEVRKYRSALLYELAAMDARSGWVQQFHIGANRNNNKRMFKLLGPDTGFDAIDDQPVAVSMNRFQPFRSRRAVSENDRLQPESPRHRVDGSQCLQFQRRQCTREDAIWSGLVVPRSDQRHGRSVKRTFQPRSFKPFRRYADRFPQLPVISPP